MIKETIFDLFRRSKYKVGHMVPMRTTNNIFMQLIQEGYVEYKDGSLPNESRDGSPTHTSTRLYGQLSNINVHP